MKKELLLIITAAVMLTACGNSAAEETTAAEITTETTVETTATYAKIEYEIDPSSAETTSAVSETNPESQETVAEEPAEETVTTAAETTAAEEITIASEMTTAETVVTTTETEEPASEEEIVIDESDEEMTVNSKFADMDEFLTSDLFMLDGKTVSANKSLSADIFNTMKGDFYLETSEFDGTLPFKFAVKDDMIMTESESDGKSNKMIIRDSRAFTFDHENKVALFIPAEKELTSQYTPEKMGIIPENISKESFVIADVIIGGTDYKFEYGTTSDWAMLYTSDGKLYASVKSGDSLDCELCKFSVTSKIPSGTFDIPEDYMQLDLEAMMQNAPTADME